MESLIQHIEYLLRTHDCVIIPGLGAFIASSRPAVIDYADKKILPPSRFIMFNQAVTNDDGLLVNSYSRKYSLSFEEARQVIIREVDNLFRQLNQGLRVKLGRIGSLSLSEESNLIFQPENSLSLEESLGLCPVGITHHLSNLNDDTQIPVNSTDPGHRCNQEYNDKDNSERIFGNSKGNNPEEEEEIYYHIKIRRSFLNGAAVIALVISLFLAALIFPVPYDSREQRASVVPVEAIISHKTENIVDTINVFKASAIDSISTSISEEKEISDNKIQNPSKSSFYLIVGTFKNYDEAEKFRNLNTSDDYPLFTVQSKKLTRVAVASSDSKEELQSKLNSGSFLKRFPNSWIWSSL